MLRQLIKALLNPPPFYNLVEDAPQQKDQKPQQNQEVKERNV